MLSAICFNLDKSKILSSGNGLSLAKPNVTSSEVLVRTLQGCSMTTSLFSLNPFPNTPI